MSKFHPSGLHAVLSLNALTNVPSTDRPIPVLQSH